MAEYFIGWDVGGWNCDNNGHSRDAIVMLDDHRQIMGVPWRGNLRVAINEAKDTFEWVQNLFRLCEVEAPPSGCSVTVGIDTPLGFSAGFLELIGELTPAASIDQSNENPYLFRETERFLFRHGFTPLSAVKDMIGSQATKGMHVLAKFAPENPECGVWKGCGVLTAIEAYPSPCKHSAIITSLREDYPPLNHNDKEDALTCALIAYLFARQRDQLQEATDKAPIREGWIWIPKDILN